jgi:hypothetical protein
VEFRFKKTTRSTPQIIAVELHLLLSKKRIRHMSAAQSHQSSG